VVESDVPLLSRARDLVIGTRWPWKHASSSLEVARKRKVLRSTTLRQDEDVQGNSKAGLRRTSAGVERASPGGCWFAKRWADRGGLEVLTSS